MFIGNIKTGQYDELKDIQSNFMFAGKAVFVLEILRAQRIIKTQNDYEKWQKNISEGRQ